MARSVASSEDKTQSWWLGPALAAAIALGAQVEVPLLEVPFTLQSFGVLLAGFLLGSRRGFAAVALYLLAGVAGLPVFAGGASGASRLLGPTGGFLWSFLPAAAIAGLARRGGVFEWRRGLGWGVVATLALLAIGLAWLAVARGLGGGQALPTGISLLPGAAIKLFLAVLAGVLLSSGRRG
jgi:biotin transport system substrate-specific component